MTRDIEHGFTVDDIPKNILDESARYAGFQTYQGMLDSIPAKALRDSIEHHALAIYTIAVQRSFLEMLLKGKG